MNRIKVFPMQDYYSAFLATREIKCSEDNEDILHYFGESKRELKKLINKDKVQFIIIHNSNFPWQELDVPFAYDHVTKSNDIFKKNEVYTNCVEAAKMYYRKLGLQKDLLEYKRPKKNNSKKVFSFEKIKEIMMWK